MKKRIKAWAVLCCTDELTWFYNPDNNLHGRLSVYITRATARKFGNKVVPIEIIIKERKKK